jgi:tetratricopeptide (TPR) repeat protein
MRRSFFTYDPKSVTYPILKNILLLSVYIWILSPHTLLAAHIPVKKTDPVIDSLKTALTKTLDDTFRIRTLNLIAIKLQYENTAEALEYAEKALDLAVSIKNKSWERIVLNTKGTVLLKSGDYSEALFCFLRSLRMAEMQNKSIRAKAPVYNNIGNCYLHLNQYDIARTYYQKVIKQHDSLMVADRDFLAHSYANLGNVEGYSNDYSKAIAYYKKALFISQASEQKEVILLNIAISYMQMDSLKLAEDYCKRIFPLIGNNPEGLIAYYNCMGNIYMKQKRYDLAEKCFYNAKGVIASSGINNSKSSVYKNIAYVNEYKHDFKNAYLHYKEYKTMEDSILNESTGKKMIELQKNYEIEKRDREIQLLNQKQQIAEADSNNQRLVIVLLFLATAVIVMIGRNVILKQRVKNKTLNAEKALVEKVNIKLLHENTEAKYEVLKSKIDPHFLFNSLSTLSSLVKESEEMSLRYIQSFSGLYRAILETSELNLFELQQELKIVKHYLHLQKMEFDDNLIIDMDISEQVYPYLLPPFSIQMAVENAIKHNIITSKDKLHISIFMKDNTIVIENSFQKKSIKPVSTKTGQKSIEERYKLVSGERPIFEQVENLYRVVLPLLNPTPRTTNDEILVA